MWVQCKRTSNVQVSVVNLMTLALGSKYLVVAYMYSVYYHIHRSLLPISKMLAHTYMIISSDKSYSVLLLVRGRQLCQIMSISANIFSFSF